MQSLLHTDSTDQTKSAGFQIGTWNTFSYRINVCDYILNYPTEVH